MAAKHDWNDLENYLHVVLRVVDHDPFVVRHALEFELSPEAGTVSGDVFCHGDIVIDVTKYFEIRTTGKRRQARTIGYAYHARYGDGEDILRYDNNDRHPNHPTAHHKHEFHSGGDTVTHVGTGWPHLSECLDELKRLVWGGEGAWRLAHCACAA